MSNDNTNINPDLAEFDTVINTDLFGAEEGKLYDFLTERVIGQDRAARHLADAFTIRNAGLSEENKPLAVKLFVGPTGVGKTEMAEQLARFFIPVAPGEPAPVTKIDCGNLTSYHEVASTLLGPPPGYIGYETTVPAFAQTKLDGPHAMFLAEELIAKKFPGKARPKDMDEFMETLYRRRLRGKCRSVLILDEVEKAHATLWDVLLGILDKATVTLRDGEVTSFQNTVIILTSNVNARSYQDMITGRQFGLGHVQSLADKRPVDDEATIRDRDKQMYANTFRELQRIFRAEFIGRMRGDVVQFHALSRENSSRILDLKLAKIQARFSGANGTTPLTIRFAPEFKEHLLNEGAMSSFGVRELEATIRGDLVRLLGRAITSGELLPGDEVLCTIDSDGKPCFRRRARTAAQIISARRLPAGAGTKKP